MKNHEIGLHEVPLCAWELVSVTCEICKACFFVPANLKRADETSDQWENIQKALRLCEKCFGIPKISFLDAMFALDRRWREYTCSGIAPHIQDMELVNAFRDIRISGGALIWSRNPNQTTPALHFLDSRSLDLLAYKSRVFSYARTRRSFGLTLY